MSLFGHPVHPMLVPLPMGAFAFSLLSLIVYVFVRDPFWLAGSYWLAIGGVAGALLAAVFGLLDWMGIPEGSKNKSIGAWHMVLNMGLVGLFFLSWLALGGLSGPGAAADTAVPLLLQIVAVLMLVVSGWLGGEMVYGRGEEQPKAEEQPKRPERTAA